MENFKYYRSAGILPYAIKPDGKLVFLLGKENEGINLPRGGVYNSFSGMKEYYEKDPEETAIREFDEETMGAVIDVNDVKKLLKKKHIVIMTPKEILFNL